MQCTMFTFGNSPSYEFDINGEEMVQKNVISRIMAKALERIRIFPWNKAESLFI